MKYTKDNYIIDLNLEILILIQSKTLDQPTWINIKQKKYMEMLEKELNFNLKEIIDLKKFFTLNEMSFHKLPQIILSMDNKFNIDVVELKKQGINIANIKEFEKLVKNLYLKIDLNYIYEKYKNFLHLNHNQA